VSVTHVAGFAAIDDALRFLFDLFALLGVRAGVRLIPTREPWGPRDAAVEAVEHGATLDRVLRAVSLEEVWRSVALQAARALIVLLTATVDVQ
jgi:hypothetical protein